MKPPLVEPTHTPICEHLMDHQGGCSCGAYDTPEGKAWLEEKGRSLQRVMRTAVREVAGWPRWMRGGRGSSAACGCPDKTKCCGSCAERTCVHCARRPGSGGQRQEVGMIRELFEAIRSSWDLDTGALGSERAPGSPKGQCAVTALVVQDLCGGELFRADLGPPYGSHYWNRIPGMGDIDLTLSQFPAGLVIPSGDVVPRSRLLEGERALAAKTPERYHILRLRTLERHKELMERLVWPHQ